MNRSIIGLAIFLNCSLSSTVFAAGIPSSEIINYSGTLYENNQPVSGSRSITISFHNDASASASNQVCTTTNPSTTITQGAFRVVLNNSCVVAVRNNRDLWARVTVSGTPNLTLPATKIPAALFAVEAERAQVATTAIAPATGSQLETSLNTINTRLTTIENSTNNSFAPSFGTCRDESIPNLNLSSLNQNLILACFGALPPALLGGGAFFGIPPGTGEATAGYYRVSFGMICQGFTTSERRACEFSIIKGTNCSVLNTSTPVEVVLRRIHMIPPGSANVWSVSGSTIIGMDPSEQLSACVSSSAGTVFVAPSSITVDINKIANL